MKRIVAAIKRVLEGVVALTMGALVVDVLWGVFSRFILGAAAQWTDELAQLLMVWTALLGAAFAYVEKQHLGVDLLPLKVGPAARPWVDAFSDLVVAIFAAVAMVYGGSILTAQRFEAGQVLPALGVSRGWVYLAVPVGGVLILFRALIGVAAPWRRRRDASQSLASTGV